MNKQLSLFKETISPAFFEYFFIIPPDDETANHVKFLKRKLDKTINLSSENLFSKAHISLFNRQSKNSTDNYIINTTTKALHNKEKFGVKIKGINIFDHSTSKSLVLQIENIDSITEIHRTLLHSFNIPFHQINPHITIARSVSVQEFIKINQSLNEFNYTGEFACERIRILKRTITGSERGKYEILFDVLL
jgi:2'-5' RNA ligase